MATYSSIVSRRSRKTVTPVPVTTRLPGKKQILNSTGGYGFALDKWKQLDRFLILGAASPTYYASQDKLVKDNAGVALSCIAENGKRVVDRVVQISDEGRAPKNDPALFVLALVTANGNAEARSYAFQALPKVARIGTHLLHYCDFVSDLRGWGRGLQKSVASWFNDKDAKALAYQVLKYRQRDGWSMRDVLRVSHPRQHGHPSDTHQAIYHYLTKGWESVGAKPHPDPALNVIWAFERAKLATTEKEIAKLVRDYRMPWEFLDTKWLNSNAVWEALLENIKPEALIRNLGRLSANGFITDFGDNTKAIISKITNEESLKAARMHPFKILTALRTYQQGKGMKGSLTWTPNQKVVNALDDAFYLAHKFVEPTNKNIFIALDVSGSMDSSCTSGLPLTARDVACAIGMSIAKTEPWHKLTAISAGLTEMTVGPRQRLDEILRYTSSLNFSWTDLSLPMTWAKSKEIREVDAFIVVTDQEVNAGSHPVNALDQYQQWSGRASKFVTIGVTATNFTIADPNRTDMIDCVGMDVNVPTLVNDFIADKLL